MSDRVELMCLYWTSAGFFPGRGDVSRFGFRDRAEAAAKAGFSGIGIWHSDLEHSLSSMSLKDMRAILEDNGLKHLELEFLTDWFLEGEKRQVSDARRRLLLEASEALGAKHIKVGDFDRSSRPLPLIVEAFAELCAEAKDYGATIAFEFMPSSMIDNLRDSLAMVEAAGAANGGLALDIVHVMNQAVPFEELSMIPPGRLVSVELNDGTLPGSPNRDPGRERRFCGEGEYDIPGFISAIKKTGYSGPWAVEVFSEELCGLPLEELMTRAFATTMRIGFS
jgi:sugar phosphate isomerase/epimerase